MLKQQKVNKKHKELYLEWLQREDFGYPAVVSLFLFLVLIISACSSDIAASSYNGNSSKTAVSQSNPVSKTTTRTTTTYPVKVYFSRLPLSNTNFDAVFPVDRLSPTSSTGTFAIQQLVTGPNAAESGQGYFSEIKDHLVGSSVCSPATTKAGFTLSLNMKGTTNEQGTATLKFCQQFSSAGVGTDARAIAEINATLMQFASIKKVVILTPDSHCFGDESGTDRCLH